MRLLPISPGSGDVPGGRHLVVRRWRQRRTCGRRVVHSAMNEALDEVRLQSQLLGVGDVLPRTAATGAEVPALWHDAMRRRNEDRGERGTSAVERDADALTRDGERHG